MRRAHVTHLLTRYVHGQLRPAAQARVLNHCRTCAQCRAALAQHERQLGDLSRELKVWGQPQPAQLARVWAGVWNEVGPARPQRRWGGGLTWLPGLSVMLALVLTLAVALPALAQNGLRVEAAPGQGGLQALPVSTASPTPGATDTYVAPQSPDMLVSAGGDRMPRATVALMVGAGLTPAPVPAATVSPEASVFRR